MPAAHHELRRVGVSAEIGNKKVVRLSVEAPDKAERAGLTSHVSNTLAFPRNGVIRMPLAFLLEDTVFEDEDTRPALSKAFDKNTLVNFLTEYYQADTAR